MSGDEIGSVDRGRLLALMELWADRVHQAHTAHDEAIARFDSLDLDKWTTMHEQQARAAAINRCRHEVLATLGFGTGTVPAADC